MATAHPSNADPAAMDENPYKAPQADQTAAGSYSGAGSLLRTGLIALVLALGTVAVSTVGGCIAGGMGGMLVQASMPRETRPQCGNTILVPAGGIGLVTGAIIGVLLAERRLRRYLWPASSTSQTGG